MKLTTALVALAGTASAISSLLDLEDGLYVVSAKAGYPDFSTSIRVNNTTYLPEQEVPFSDDLDLDLDLDAESGPERGNMARMGYAKKGKCVAALKNPKYTERPGEYAMDDYRKARRDLEKWIERGPGYLFKNYCWYGRYGTAAVGACSYHHSNPVCKAELDTAMLDADRARELGGCGGPNVSCAVQIAKWDKFYCRLSVLEAVGGGKC
ncbi:hypothetical protein F4775DRAFT_590622 [Biscogniauxia sp. FL1348]|nr:hypothetical protein F4775DRAFT_590622 [Biscogniauxia sp. FL1348]